MVDTQNTQTTKTIKDKVVAGANSAETFIESWWAYFFSFIPASWRKYIALIIIAALAIGYFFGVSLYGLGATMWSYVPAREHVTPVTVTDLNTLRTSLTTDMVSKEEFYQFRDVVMGLLAKGEGESAAPAPAPAATGAVHRKKKVGE